MAGCLFLATRRGAAHASWDVCMVLISDKADTPALLKSLSTTYEGKVAFGFVRSNKEALVSKLLPEGASAPKMPALVTICNGDLSMRALFSGQLKSDPLTRWAGDMHAGLQGYLQAAVVVPGACYGRNEATGLCRCTLV